MEFIPRSAPVVSPEETRRRLIREIGVAAVAAALAMPDGAGAHAAPFHAAPHPAMPAQPRAA